jgi:mannose-6-phosphate isomerase-like protein (cupin superfamily)
MKKKLFSIVRLSNIKRDGRWILVRKSLDLRSFGMNMVRIAPGGTIPEHDETERDQEEVFMAWKGNMTMVIDGKRYPMPEGTFVRVSPKAMRTVINSGKKPALLLIASAPTTSGYKPMSWG